MRAFCLTLLLALASAACGPSVDLKTVLKVEDITTGWYDAGLVDGQNKLVPSISFKFRNTADVTIPTLQANVIFRRMGEDTEWGSEYLKITGSEGLASGAQSQRVTAKSQRGYTGTDPRPQMLQHSQFVDARVQVFAKYASTNWTLVGEFPVERKLLTQ
jgi:hypothetical protein